jgi:hypothetical protein
MIVTTTTAPKRRGVKRNAPARKISEKKTTTVVLQPKKQRRRRKAKTPSQGRPLMSECASDYLLAVTDPWTMRTAGRFPCVPDLIDVPSNKHGSTLRGQLTVGTAGFGFIHVNPFMWGNNDIIGCCSDVAYAGTTVAAVTSAGTTNLIDTRMPYTANNTASYRLVAAGLRIQYTGTELNRGGQIIAASNCANNGSMIGFNYDRLASLPDVTPQSCTRGWRGCIARPLMPIMFQYQTTPVGDGNQAFLTIGINGPVGNTFQFELVRFFEAISDGDITVNSTSQSHSDIVGMSSIRDALGQVSQSEFGQSLYAKSLSLIKDAVFRHANQLLLGPAR